MRETSKPTTSPRAVEIGQPEEDEEIIILPDEDPIPEEAPGLAPFEPVEIPELVPA